MYCEHCGAEVYMTHFCFTCGNETKVPADAAGVKYYGGARPTADHQIHDDDKPRLSAGIVSADGGKVAEQVLSAIFGAASANDGGE